MRAVASCALRSLVAGQHQGGRVTAVFDAAAYADVGGAVLALVASDGIRLPNAVALPAPSAARPLRGLVPGAPAVAGGGRVRFGAVTATVTDWWDPTVVRRVDLEGSGEVNTPPMAQLASVAGPWPRPNDVAAASLHRAARDLESALVTLNPVMLHTVAGRLVGLGGGMTPAGDDLLAGALAGLHAFGGPAKPLAGAVRPHLHRTTPLSAALLNHAARGEVAEPAQAVLEALTCPERLPGAARRLLSLGHSSGRDLTAGLLLGGRVALSLKAAA